MSPLMSLLGLTDRHPLVATLDALEVADAAVRSRWPQGNEPKGLFLALMPPLSLRGKAPQLYASFANELAERALHREALEPATDAEVLVAMMATATRTPLNQEGQLVAEVLFERIFPGVVPMSTRESYRGQLEESLRALRHRLRVPRSLHVSVKEAA